MLDRDLRLATDDRRPRRLEVDVDGAVASLHPSNLCRRLPQGVDDLAGPGLVALERFLVWVPPLLGGATVLAAVGLARRHFGRAEAWLGGLLLAFLSAHFWYSQIGFVDHHAAVAWLSTLSVSAGMGGRDTWRTGRTARLGGVAGGAVAASALHIVRSGDKLRVLSKDRLGVRDTYVNTSQWTADDIAAYAEVFPEGYFVALIDGVPVGQGAGIYLDFDFDDPQHTIAGITGEHQCGNHDPRGQWYYGTDISVHPDHRGQNGRTCPGLAMGKLVATRPRQPGIRVQRILRGHLFTV